MSSLIARKVISKLLAEKSSILNDQEKKTEISGLDKDKTDLLPSELKRLGEEISRKRLSASPMPKEELDALMRRIGKK